MWLDTPKTQRMFQQGERLPAGRGYDGYFAASEAFELAANVAFSVPVLFRRQKKKVLARNLERR